MRDPRPLRVVCAFAFRSTTGQRRRPYSDGRGWNGFTDSSTPRPRLRDQAPLDYIDATIAAGYDGIGLRVHRPPGLPFHPVVGDAALIRELKARAHRLP